MYQGIYPNLPAACLSLVIYILLLFLTLYTIVLSLRIRVGLKVPLTQYVFQVSLGTALGMRVAWVVLVGLTASNVNVFAHEIVNRIALLSFFTAYSFVVATWAEAMQWAPLTARRWFQRPYVLFSIENLIFYGFEITVMATRGDQTEANPKSTIPIEVTYEEEMLVAAIMFLLHSLLFIWYGANVIFVLRNATLLGDRRVSGTIRNIFLATSMCGALTILRFVLFAWYPMTDTFFSGNSKAVLYPYWFYDIPEWITTLVLLHVYTASGVKDSIITQSEPLVNEAMSSDQSESTFLGHHHSESTYSTTDDRVPGSIPRSGSLDMVDGRPNPRARRSEDAYLTAMDPLRGGTEEDEDERGGLRSWLLGMLGTK